MKDAAGGDRDPGERLELRPATPDDAHRLLAWRNDPRTRASSFDERMISPAEHRAWLEAAFADPGRLLFIAVEAGVAVGTVRADAHGDTWRVSWTVAPEARGRGVAVRMVKKFVDGFPRPLLAEVKNTNPASIRVAEAAGFRQISEMNGILQFERPARTPDDRPVEPD
jgi:RimJ/RimL family protein N-acetyltransferase